PPRAGAAWSFPLPCAAIVQTSEATYKNRTPPAGRARPARSPPGGPLLVGRHGVQLVLARGELDLQRVGAPLDQCQQRLVLLDRHAPAHRDVEEDRAPQAVQALLDLLQLAAQVGVGAALVHDAVE